MSDTKPHRVTKPFFTTGTIILLLFMAVGTAFGLARLFTGLGEVTNLDDQHPWGIWIAIDVACGVALAAGGFTTAALVEIFGRRKYHVLLRPAILTAWLGYTIVAVGLLYDLGRYWNIWRPMVNWQGNSVLFEVGMCVMAYLFVLTTEMAPALLEGSREWIAAGGRRRRWILRLEHPAATLQGAVRVVLPLFIVAGVVLSCMHQSSLGTLMVIASTKLSPLWQTPLLPLLFLLSAIMVGFPMVIVESVIATRSFGRVTEMEVLEPLARKIPWFIGVYGAVKIGDLIARRDRIDPFGDPATALSLLVELIVGLALPFVLLQFPWVRRSTGWLMFSSTLVIFGVVLNRFNVFVGGYQPPFAHRIYYPAVGEIAVTVGLVCMLMFLYRLVATWFPVLSGYVAPSAIEVERDRLRRVPPVWEHVVRGLAAASLLMFVVLYTFVHQEALARSQQSFQEIKEAREAAAALPHRVRPSPSHSFRPKEYRNFYILNTPILNDQSDYYEPVRFSHRTHDEWTGGDCSACHHRLSYSNDDRVGEDLKALHRSIDVRLGGPCTSCHEGMSDKNLQSCARCHAFPNEPDSPSRIGLKGAYHRQCIGCHEELPSSAFAPTDCDSCHHPLVPNHADLVSLGPAASASEVTAECIRCHGQAADDVVGSAHWRWSGQVPAVERFDATAPPKLDWALDNYQITLLTNPNLNARFHVGPGRSAVWAPASIAGMLPAAAAGSTGVAAPPTVRAGGHPAVSETESVDCVVCHDATERLGVEMEKSPDTSAVDFSTIARRVGRPAREDCGTCHFYLGGWPNAMHGDLEPQLAAPEPDFDFHMGVVDMRCQDCHLTDRHKISGKSFFSPVSEGRVGCERCHSTQPHGITGILGRHLDDHVRSLACETCHIPSYARETPTLLETDFSHAGEKREATMDRNGRPLFDARYGTLAWGKNLVPAYRWFDGTRQAYFLGDKIDPSSTVVLNAPLGERRDPVAKIFPFKMHAAMQPYDTEQNILVAPRLEGGYWKDYQWEKAIREGMAAAGMTFSEKYGFVRTEFYSSIHHGMVPAGKALGCADCHRKENVTCMRCHKSAKGMDEPSHTRPVHPETKDRIDFKALGYTDDPALVGGRLFVQLGRGVPPR